MESVTDLQVLLRSYIQANPEEKETLEEFESYLARTEPRELYSRKNFDGHITASCFIVDNEMKNMLLLFHVSLQKWLQPGGHVDTDTDDNILTASYRECQEETGLSAEQLEQISSSENIYIPFDIDSHSIPASKKKQEEAHIHHDLRYLFRCKDKTTIILNTEESSNYQWVSIAELKNNAIFHRVHNKINNLNLQFHCK